MITRRQTISMIAAGIPAGVVAWIAGPAFARATQSHGGRVLEQSLQGMDNKEVTLDVVEYGPGEHGTPHRHPGPVFGYILEGSFRMQFLPEPARVYSEGQAFYEPAMHVHEVCQNLNATKPARFLAMMIKEKGQPEVLPA
jgi:quercetin dioxygenase-like cupin family protein